MEMITKFITPGLAFILSLIFGFWLSKAGKPYNGILFNIHKLVALGAVIVTGMQIYKQLKGFEFQTPIVILIIIAGACVVALFVGGAFMSVGKLNYQVLKLVHGIAPVLATISMVTMICMLSILEQGG